MCVCVSAYERVHVAKDKKSQSELLVFILSRDLGKKIPHLTSVIKSFLKSFSQIISMFLSSVARILFLFH